MITVSINACLDCDQLSPQSSVVSVAGSAFHPVLPSFPLHFQIQHPNEFTSQITHPTTETDEKPPFGKAEDSSVEHNSGESEEKPFVEISPVETVEVFKPCEPDLPSPVEEIEDLGAVPISHEPDHEDKYYIDVHYEGQIDDLVDEKVDLENPTWIQSWDPNMEVSLNENPDEITALEPEMNEGDVNQFSLKLLSVEEHLLMPDETSCVVHCEESDLKKDHERDNLSIAEKVKPSMLSEGVAFAASNQCEDAADETITEHFTNIEHNFVDLTNDASIEEEQFEKIPSSNENEDEVMFNDNSAESFDVAEINSIAVQVDPVNGGSDNKEKVNEIEHIEKCGDIARIATSEKEAVELPDLTVEMTHTNNVFDELESELTKKVSAEMSIEADVLEVDDNEETENFENLNTDQPVVETRPLKEANFPEQTDLLNDPQTQTIQENFEKEQNFGNEDLVKDLDVNFVKQHTETFKNVTEDIENVKSAEESFAEISEAKNEGRSRKAEKLFYEIQVRSTTGSDSSEILSEFEEIGTEFPETDLIMNELEEPEFSLQTNRTEKIENVVEPGDSKKLEPLDDVSSPGESLSESSLKPVNAKAISTVNELDPTVETKEPENMQTVESVKFEESEVEFIPHEMTKAKKTQTELKVNIVNENDYQVEAAVNEIQPEKLAETFTYLEKSADLDKLGDIEDRSNVPSKVHEVDAIISEEKVSVFLSNKDEKAEDEIEKLKLDKANVHEVDTKYCEQPFVEEDVLSANKIKTEAPLFDLTDDQNLGEKELGSELDIKIDATVENDDVKFLHVTLPRKEEPIFDNDTDESFADETNVGWIITEGMSDSFENVKLTVDSQNEEFNSEMEPDKMQSEITVSTLKEEDNQMEALSEIEPETPDKTVLADETLHGLNKLDESEDRTHVPSNVHQIEETVSDENILVLPLITDEQADDETEKSILDKANIHEVDTKYCEQPFVEEDVLSANKIKTGAPLFDLTDDQNLGEKELGSELDIKIDATVENDDVKFLHVTFPRKEEPIFDNDTGERFDQETNIDWTMTEGKSDSFEDVQLTFDSQNAEFLEIHQQMEGLTLKINNFDISSLLTYEVINKHGIFTLNLIYACYASRFFLRMK